MPDHPLSPELPGEARQEATREDHRIRVARERRERTRGRLLDTILATYRGEQHRGPAVLDEVLRAAAMSKSNFYKHFPSLEAAVSELGELLATEMAVAIVANYAHVTSPPERLATGFQLFLSRAAIDPRWGTFVTHGTFLNPAHKLLLEVRRDFEAGIACGDYRIRILDAAVHLTVGAMVEGMRYLLVKPAQPCPYVQDLTAMVLCAMGVTSARAHAVTHSAAERLYRDAPGLFPWWKTPDE